MRGTDFIFDYADLMYYKCQNKSELCSIIYIYSPHWIKIKKATIDPVNKKIINAFNMP